MHTPNSIAIPSCASASSTRRATRSRRASISRTWPRPSPAAARSCRRTRSNPWRTYGRAVSKPIVVAVHGLCLTLGIELLLAADVRVAADDARFAQVEIKRGIFPFGGGCARWVSTCGWGNAMRYLLTGDELDAREAERIGLVQEVVPGGAAAVLERALALAGTIAAQAPLGVQATLASARLATAAGEQAAARELLPTLQRLMGSDDAREGLLSFMERRAARFTGR